jgi:phosphoribosylanthranilate isomerase
MLESVTITGADDAVDVASLVALSTEFPFVEWGILVSELRAGTSRYPSREWMIALEDAATHHVRTNDVSRKPMKLAAHFCGAVARAALAGRLHDLPVIERAQRIQVNGYVAASFGLALFAQKMPCYEVILQVRLEAELQNAAHEVMSMRSGSLLFDPSGGRGIEPFKWPRAPLGARMGYAGGIGPENVVDVVQRIYEDSGMLTSEPFWIDMESGVRTDDRFDLGKACAVLEAVKQLCCVPPAKPGT